MTLYQLIHFKFSGKELSDFKMIEKNLTRNKTSMERSSLERKFASHSDTPLYVKLHYCLSISDWHTDKQTKMPWFVDNFTVPGEFCICVPLCAHLRVDRLTLNWIDFLWNSFIDWRTLSKSEFTLFPAYHQLLLPFLICFFVWVFIYSFFFKWYTRPINSYIP